MIEQISPQQSLSSGIYQVERTPRHSVHLYAVILTLLISLILRVDSILGFANWLYDVRFDSAVLYVLVFAVRFLLGGATVLVVARRILPPEIGQFTIGDRVLPSRYQAVLGFISGLLFLIVAALLSIILDIFHLDFTIIFGLPNVYVDPDVTGWAFFLIALVPAVWEELLFRGLLLTLFLRKYSSSRSIVLSSLYFALYHFSTIVVWPIEQVIGGVVMSFLFGLAWGSLVIRTKNVSSAIIAHYLVDSLGQLFLNVKGVDPVISAQYMILLTVIYPVVHWTIFRWIVVDELNGQSISGS